MQPSPTFTPHTTTDPLGLYIHIPWCHTRCIYCDFNTYVDGSAELHRRYTAALRREIREAGAVLGNAPLQTVFFGGGTPTLLPPQELIEILDEVRGAFALAADAEITTEANPGTLTVDYLRTIRAGGINRLSMGVQSFDDAELKFLSRLHDANTARQAVAIARQADFDNVSLDLIFNLPHQSLAAWQHNIQEALRLAPDHLSLYSLIVEPNTPLHKQVMNGQVAQPEDDAAADMYAYTIDTLGAAGYGHYEISNWAKVQGEAAWESPRRAAQHNLIYWRNQPYVGVGAGAYGTVNGERWGNVKRPQRYIQMVEAGEGLGMARDSATAEHITREGAMTEAMMMGLRLVRQGVSVEDFSHRYDVDFKAHYAEAIERGMQRGLLEWVQTPTDLRLCLTATGRFLANEAILPFFD
jgi:oxygen-independent coproporphyrinogen-3 oxidase